MGLVVGDADILISLMVENDINHFKTKKLVKKLIEKKYLIRFPNTAILEAITTLRRALSKPEAAQELNRQFLGGVYNVVYIDSEIQRSASEIFAGAKSKKNTIFDAVVASCAKKVKADGIFSFDEWYEKSGFLTAEKVLRS